MLVTRDVIAPSAGPARPAPFGVAGRRRTLLDGRAATAVALLALTTLAGVMRLGALGSALWLDEAQTTAIAQAPLRELPTLLRLDGSPPLYYALLHVWMAVAGTTEARVHLLSAGLAALCVPAGWWVARAAHGR